MVAEAEDPVRVGGFVLALANHPEAYLLITTGRKSGGDLEWRVHTRLGGRQWSNAGATLVEALRRAAARHAYAERGGR